MSDSECVALLERILSVLEQDSVLLDTFHQRFLSFYTDLTNINSLIMLLVFCIGVLICVDIFHHLFDAFYKRK